MQNYFESSKSANLLIRPKVELYYMNSKVLFLLVSTEKTLFIYRIHANPKEILYYLSNYLFTFTSSL